MQVYNGSKRNGAHNSKSIALYTKGARNYIARALRRSDRQEAKRSTLRELREVLC